MLNSIILRCTIERRDIKCTLREICFSQNERWWWLRDCRRSRGGDERNLGWQMRQEKDRIPHDGGPERLSAALPDWHTLAALLPGPFPEFGEAEHNVRLLWTDKYTCSDTQSDRWKYKGRQECTQLFGGGKAMGCHVKTIWESTTGEVFTYVSGDFQQGRRAKAKRLV